MIRRFLHGALEMMWPFTRPRSRTHLIVAAVGAYVLVGLVIAALSMGAHNSPAMRDGSRAAGAVTVREPDKRTPGALSPTSGVGVATAIHASRPAGPTEKDAASRTLARNGDRFSRQPSSRPFASPPRSARARQAVVASRSSDRAATVLSDAHLELPATLLTPTVTLTGPNAASTGPVTYSVTVSGTGASPTGSVTVSDGTNTCTIPSLDSTGSGSCAIVENAGNSPFTVVASYSGDSNYTSASSDAIDETVSPVTPAMTLTGQSLDAETVEYDVSVSGPTNADVPTGSVTVSDGNLDCTIPSLDSSGSGSCQIVETSDGPFIVTANYGGDSNYTSATAVPTPTVTVTDNSSGVVAGGSFAFTARVAGPGYAVTPTGKVAWSLVGPGSPSCADSKLTSGVATCTLSRVQSGAYSATATYLGDTNYTGSSGSDSTATVGEATLTITASSGTMTYGGTPPTITASYSGFVDGDSPASLTTLPTCSTKATSHSSVSGSPYASSCSGASDPNYTIVYVSGTVTVKKASLAITASSGTMTYGGTPPAITPSYSGFVNGDSAASLSNQPSCSTTATSSSTVAGSPYPSSCSGASDSNYEISYVAGTVAVAKAPLTVTASSGSMTYGGNPPAITPIYSGFVNGDSAASLTAQPSCSTTADSSSTVAGSPYSSSCSGAAGANYQISYVAGSVTVNKAALTITASSGSMTYGGTPPAISASFSGFVNGDSAASLSTQPTCSTTATSASPVAGSPYPSSCLGAADSNYKFSYVAGTVTVNTAPLSITASSTSMTYGGTSPAITPQYSGFVNGDSASSLANQPACSTTANSSSTVAGSPYPSSCSGAVDSNYKISYAGGSVTVNRAPLTVTASSTSMTYGGTPPAITPQYSGFVNGDSASSLTTQASCSTTATSSSGVAGSPYASSCSGAAGANYKVSYVAGTVTVNKAALTVTASSGSMTYGGTPPTISASFSGFVNGDSASSLTTQPSCLPGASSSSPVAGSPYSSSCSGAAASNYKFTYVAGSVTVNKAALTITASSGSMTYGGTPPTISAIFSGFVNGDSASSLTTAPRCSTTATSSSQVEGSPYASSCSQAVDTNYKISYVGGAVTVNKAPLTVTASSGTTTYGGTVPAITPSYSGFVNGDEASSLTTRAECSTTATSSSVVGSYPSACSDAADPNYSISYVAGNIVISQATPTVAATGEAGQSTGPVKITVTVNGPGLDGPTGEVTVSDPSGNSCPSPIALVSGTGSCMLVENASEDGQLVTASYMGDSNYAPSTATTPEDVAPATPTVTIDAPSEAVTGSIFYEVAVSGAGAAPTGNVAISDGTNTCDTGLLVSGGGGCSLTENTGTYKITASFNAPDKALPGMGLDANYAATSVTTTEVVNETSTALSVSKSVVTYGTEQRETFTATVTWAPQATPASGTVLVKAGALKLCEISLSEAFVPDPPNPPTPVETGTCSLKAGELASGHFSVVADYLGLQGDFLASTSSSQPVMVNAAASSTLLSLSSSTTTYGSENREKLTAIVRGPVGVPYATGEAIISADSRKLCVVRLEHGTASCTLARTELSVGHHALMARYSGSASLLVSTSAGDPTLLVERAGTSTLLSLSPARVPYGAGHRVLISVEVVAPAGVGFATGTVLVASGSRTLCAVALVHGRGSCVVASAELPVGSHRVSARYEGTPELHGSMATRVLTVVKPAP